MLSARLQHSDPRKSVDVSDNDGEERIRLSDAGKPADSANKVLNDNNIYFNSTNTYNNNNYDNNSNNSKYNANRDDNYHNNRRI